MHPVKEGEGRGGEEGKEGRGSEGMVGGKGRGWKRKERKK